MALEAGQFAALMGVITALSCAEDVPVIRIGDSFIGLLGLARNL
jgi:hypothetical protein